MFTASDVLRHPTLRLVKAVSVLKFRLGCMHATSSTATKPGGVVRGRLASCNLHNWTHCVESCSSLCSHLCRLLKDVASSHKVTRAAVIRKLRRPQLRSPQLDQRGGGASLELNQKRSVPRNSLRAEMVQASVKVSERDELCGGQSSLFDLKWLFNLGWL